MDSRAQSRRRAWMIRLVCVVVSLSAVGVGLDAMLSGRLYYRNFWGGPVFAPLAIALGVTLLGVTLVKWRSFGRERQRLKGKAARRVERADRLGTNDRRWTV